VRYTHALDADKYASVFAEDAVFDMGRETRAGRAQIRDVITGLQKSREERQAAGTVTPSLMHHVMTNATLDVVSNREAHHYAYWMTILGEADGKYTVASMGHYEDVLMKHDGQWLIQSRRLLR
jgi:SnoaL-like protein